MTTLFLAWISAKYKYECDGLFIFAIILDICIVTTVYDLLIT